jgi:hypothetical protein
MAVFLHAERYDRIPDGFIGHLESKIDIEISVNYEEAAGEWVWKPAGFKTPEEVRAVKSRLKPRPPNILEFSAASKNRCSGRFLAFLA